MIDGQGTSNEAMAPDEAGHVGRKYSAPAAEKLLDIIEYASAVPEPMTATEIAAGLGRNVHELYRIIQVLEARGYLYRPPGSDHYHVSLKLFELAHQIPATRQLADAALPIMQALAPQAMQSCHLGVLSGRDLLIIIQANAPLPMGYSVALGARFPFEETSSGLVLYAHSAPDTRAALDRAVGNEAALATVRQQAAKILSRGHDLRPSIAVEGVTNVSAPIFDYLGHVVAALTVPYLRQRAATVPLEEVLDLTIRAGADVSRQLGAGSRRTAEEAPAPPPKRTRRGRG